YETNDDVMRDGDLLLVDAGGERQMYASDITRTYPINGRFTGPQKEVYQVVLDAEKACIEMVKPRVLLSDIHARSARLVTEGLVRLGLLRGTIEDLVENKTYKRFYMHRVTHWMGMDVHDCNTVDWETTPLEPGFVFTIEPGIYIPKDTADVP